MGFSFHFSSLYPTPYALNCMCVSLSKFHIWIFEQFKCCQKRPVLPRHIKVWVSFELFGALYMYISAIGLLEQLTQWQTQLQSQKAPKMHFLVLLSLLWNLILKVGLGYRMWARRECQSCYWVSTLQYGWFLLIDIDPTKKGQWALHVNFVASRL